MDGFVAHQGGPTCFIPPLRPSSLYSHIVLVVHHLPSQKWGALGISRRDELMYKELVFERLSDLVADFKANYERWWHKLTRARIGLPFEHDVHNNGPACWRFCSVSPTKQSWPACAASLDKFAGGVLTHLLPSAK